jgi:hypothetical protein
MIVFIEVSIATCRCFREGAARFARGSGQSLVYVVRMGGRINHATQMVKAKNNELPFACSEGTAIYVFGVRNIDRSRARRAH